MKFRKYVAIVKYFAIAILLTQLGAMASNGFGDGFEGSGVNKRSKEDQVILTINNATANKRAREESGDSGANKRSKEDQDTRTRDEFESLNSTEERPGHIVFPNKSDTDDCSSDESSSDTDSGYRTPRSLDYDKVSFERDFDQFEDVEAAELDYYKFEKNYEKYVTRLCDRIKTEKYKFGKLLDDLKTAYTNSNKESFEDIHTRLVVLASSITISCMRAINIFFMNEITNTNNADVGTGLYHTGNSQMDQNPDKGPRYLSYCLHNLVDSLADISDKFCKDLNLAEEFDLRNQLKSLKEEIRKLRVKTSNELWDDLILKYIPLYKKHIEELRNHGKDITGKHETENAERLYELTCELQYCFKHIKYASGIEGMSDMVMRYYDGIKLPLDSLKLDLDKERFSQCVNNIKSLLDVVWLNYDDFETVSILEIEDAMREGSEEKVRELFGNYIIKSSKYSAQQVKRRRLKLEKKKVKNKDKQAYEKFIKKIPEYNNFNELEWCLQSGVGNKPEGRSKESVALRMILMYYAAEDGANKGLSLWGCMKENPGKYRLCLYAIKDRCIRKFTTSEQEVFVKLSSEIYAAAKEREMQDC